MSYVFISHASQDKPRIRPLVDALQGAGLKIWLDNPAAAGFDEHQVRQFYRIRAGGRWEDEIDVALREAACVLVCWSSRATTDRALNLQERSVWFNEAFFAKTAGIMVACMVDAMNPAALPGTLSAQQLPNVDPSQGEQQWRAVSATVIDDVRRKIEESLDRRRRSHATRDLFAPYLADRSEQESIAHDAILAAANGGACPLLFVGPDNERPDEFLARLRLSSAEVLTEGVAWAETEIEWPFGVSPSAFPAVYRRHLARALRISGQPDDAAIALELERKSRPVAVLHRMLAKEWGPDEPKRIQAWLSLWNAIAAAAPRLRAIPILQVKMPAAQPGWRRCPPGASGGRVGNRTIWSGANNAVKRAAKSREKIEAAVSPVLPPITDGHANLWLNKLFPDPGPERRLVEEAIRDAYRRGRPKRHGICHEEFASIMAPLFERARGAGIGEW